MTLKEIRDECREIARDTALTDADRLWTDSEMNKYINRSVRFIARETKCIRDTQTTSICLIASDPVDYTTYTPGTLDYIWANDPNSWLYQKDVCPYLYDLDPRIIEIDEVKWTTRQWRLIKVSARKWQVNPWWEQIVGMPTEYATDVSNKTIAINYRSESSDTLRLQVRRLPLSDLSADSDEPEFRDHYHDFIRNGVLEQMYSKQDADTIDLEKAASYGAKFRLDVDEIKQQEILLDRTLRSGGSLDAFR